MAKIWVLDTETKGTGAKLVPLEQEKTPRARTPEPVFVPPKPRERPEPAPEPRRPRTFKVVDVMTREVLAEGVDARATVDILARFRSVVDVGVSVWEHETERWRPLTLGEQKVLWGFRERPVGEPGSEPAAA
jgi:hypothetical protein